MKKYFKSFFITSVVFLFPLAVRAVEIIPEGCKRGKAYISVCGLNEIMQLFVNVYDVGIQYVAIVTMLFFVVGGFVLLISGGRSNMVDAGKKILVGAFIGMFIVLTSYLLVRIIQVNVLDVNSSYIIYSDTRCVLDGNIPKPDGTVCSRDLESESLNSFNGNYTCIDGNCTTVTQCDWKYQNSSGIDYTINGVTVNVKKSCWNTSLCDSGTIESNLCPGGSDTKCCYISKEKLTPRTTEYLPKPVGY